MGVRDLQEKLSRENAEPLKHDRSVWPGRVLDARAGENVLGSMWHPGVPSPYMACLTSRDLPSVDPEWDTANERISVPYQGSDLQFAVSRCGDDVGISLELKSTVGADQDAFIPMVLSEQVFAHPRILAKKTRR